MSDRALLDEVVNRILAVADPVLVVLFGSRATGQARDDSDLDLLVIQREPFGGQRSRRREAMRITQALAGIPVSVDILLYDVTELEYWKDSLNHVLARALREGTVLYERR